MDITRIKQKETALIIAVIIIFALFGLWLRLLPMEQLTSGPIPKVLFMDPWYSMRQIEVIASNLPNYPWFDPMNGYPTGKVIDWGPLYPTFSALIAVLFRATTRNDMMTVVSWIPPLLSLIMIPVLYHIGRKVSDRKTGVIAACLTSVIAGEYLYRSFFGYLDHHFMEVLFSTAFILFYICIINIIQSKNEQVPWSSPHLILYSVLAGLMYYLGMMNIPTIVLFAGIIGIFCFLHAIITRDERSLKNLAFAHTIIFGLFILLFALTGIHEEGFNLNQYTPIHILLALVLIIEPIFLYGVIHYTHGRPAWYTNGLIIGIPALLYLLTSGIAPTITQRISDGFTYFFFFSYKETFINEMQMWDLTRAWHSFNIALVIMAIGIIITGYQVFKSYDAVKICVLTWGIVILISTILHLRYEYYVAVIVVLFSAIALAWMYDRISIMTSPIARGSIKPKTKVSTPLGQKMNKQYLPVIIVGTIILVITALSAQITWVVATEQLKIISMNDDWADGLTWLNQNSPDPGIDYLKIYPEKGFTYPSSSYGVLSWWDYGHWISYVAKRIPITTPFQNNVVPVAQFLLATNEKTADDLASTTGAKYIIIDYEMLTSKYASLPLWAFGSATNDKYQKYYYQQSAGNQNQYDPILTLKPDYFNSMLSRLYVLDGTRTNSTGANLVSYTNMQIDGQLIPAVSKIVTISPEQAEETLKDGISPGTDLVSIQYTHPIATIPALTHYRLVYESPTVTASDEYAQIHNVKIFERVTGFQISGTGTIEIPLITNQGRKFMYRQDSYEGSFIVPYSTDRENSGVHATGPYTIKQTGKTVEVTEEQILHGA
ncbi:MAG: oligosaccharyl transferase, archaeosortase A system-associated [Methanobacteriota archaeon]